MIQKGGPPPTRAELVAYKFLRAKYPGKRIVFLGNGNTKETQLDFHVPGTNQLYECKKLLGKVINFRSMAQLRLTLKSNVILISQKFEHIATVKGTDLMAWLKKKPYKIYLTKERKKLARRKDK